MIATPEEYVSQLVVPPEVLAAGQAGQSGAAAVTPAEEAFLEKYLGLGSQDFESKVPRVDPPAEDGLLIQAPTAQGAATPAAPAESSTLDLRARDDLRLVGFVLDGRELALPIETIQEVIRFVEPTRLPAAPSFMAGIINLRGRVTPLINLRVLLDYGTEGQDRFIVVCRHQDLTLGLIVTAMASIHRPRPEELEWNIEGRVGVSAEVLAGLIKTEDRLVNILSIDRLAAKVVR